MCFAEEVAVVGAAVAETLALRAHVPLDEDVLLQFYLSCSFLLDLLLHDLGSFHHRFPFGQVFLHEPQTLILLTEVHQLIFNDSFDLFI
jgi:hypothetical protein